MLRIDANNTFFGQRTQGWKELRTCFVTASSAHLVVRERPEKGYTYAESKRNEWSTNGQNFIGDIELDEDNLDVSAVIKRKNMSYGSLHETAALEDYKKALTYVYGQTYPNGDTFVESTDVSFYVNKECTLLASPDGEIKVTYVTDSGRTKQDFGLVELKCPVGQFFATPVGRERRPELAITHQVYPFLLSQGKPLKIPKPRFNFNGIMEPENYYRKKDDQSGEFRVNSPTAYHSWYVQCLCNLFTAPNDPSWIDLCVWAAHSRGQQQHQWWYKRAEISNTNEFDRIHIERFYKADPIVIKEWNYVNTKINNFYLDNAAIFERNIYNCLKKWREDSEELLESARDQDLTSYYPC